MNILSVDFDYFQKVTGEQVNRLYPDGIDNPTALSEVIWSGRYSTDGKELNAIGIMEDEYNKFKELLLSQNENSLVMIANSHRHIYDFIHENQKDGERLGIVNIDMHHDFINDNPELDCGNWLSHVAKEYKTSFNWIANPISLDVYGIGKRKEDEAILRIVEESVDSIKGEKFDAIFLCRSDTWSPPHLDKYFTELCDCCKHHFKEIEIEKGIDVSRKDYKKITAVIKKAHKELNKQHKAKESERE